VTVVDMSVKRETDLPKTEESIRRRGRKRLQLSCEEVEVENSIMNILRQNKRKYGRRRFTGEKHCFDLCLY